MKEIKISVVGLGTVGSNVIKSIENKSYEIIQKTNIKFNIVGIAAKNKDKKRIIDASKYQWFDNPLDLLGSNKCDVLIELIGEEKGLSYELIKKAITNNINVITANKALLAKHGNELFQLADANNVNILFEAAVAGGIPIIHLLKNSIFLNQIKNITGILNGTTNFILSEMEKNNLNFDQALRKATEKGYAEANPINDIEGIDSAYKITLLASLCYGVKINHNYSFFTGVNNFDKEDIKHSKKLGYRIKLISETCLIEDKIFISTSPKLININNPLAHVEGVLNVIKIETDHLNSLFIEGEGAGGLATASSVISDLYEIAKGSHHKSIGYLSSNLREIDSYERENLKRPYYLRILVKDQPGVLSKITSILTSKNISIQTILQLIEEKIDNKVPIVLTTYDTLEKNLNEAIVDISKENFLEDKIVTITIEK
jgi:homoserine dehydrogenase